MLKIEVIKFEAQDVITASGVVTPVHTDRCVNGTHHNDTYRDPSSYYYGKIWEGNDWADCGCECH